MRSRTKARDKDGPLRASMEWDEVPFIIYSNWQAMLMGASRACRSSTNVIGVMTAYPFITRVIKKQYKGTKKGGNAQEIFE